MYSNRTNINGIICDFVLAPRSKKVLLLFPGMPGYPRQDRLLFFLAKNGYNAFLIKQRGVYESSGELFTISPIKDIEEVMRGIEKGFTDVWTGEKHNITNPKYFLIGSSFGGWTGSLAGMMKKIKKIVLFAPVTDWRIDSKDEPNDYLYKVIREGYQEGYRFSKKNWDRLVKGDFHNPVKYTDKINGKKILIIHGKRDPIVTYSTSVEFAQKTGAKLIPINTKDHMGMKKSMQKRYWNTIKMHLK